MKIVLVLIPLILFFILSACKPLVNDVVTETPTQIPQALDLPVIKVDEDHYQVQRSDGKEPSMYKIPAGRGFLLDADGYQFKIPGGLQFNAPNMIQVIVGKGAIYSVKWLPSVRQYKITGETLTPLNNTKPFTEFITGQQIGVGVGYLDNNGAGGQHQFYVLWVGIINVR